MATTYSFDLFFAAPRKGDLPGPPIASICLKHWTRGGYKGEERTIFITPECVSVRELDWQIQRLKKELDQLNKKAKKKYAAVAKRPN